MKKKKKFVSAKRVVTGSRSFPHTAEVERQKMAEQRQRLPAERWKKPT